jgi:hypothetical protein
VNRFWSPSFEHDFVPVLTESEIANASESSTEANVYEALELSSIAPNRHAGSGPPLGPRMIDSNYGIFVHFVPGLTVAADGSPTSLEDLSASFDVGLFVSDLIGFGVEYVRFTAWHRGMYPLYPSPVMERWRGAGTSSSRDLLQELIDGLRGTGIRLQLYTHPRDGHDMSREHQALTGWGTSAAPGAPDPDPTSFNFVRWNDFICEVYEELGERYGEDIQSIYLDEGSERGDGEWVVDYDRLRETILQSARDVVVQQNYYGNLYRADVADHEYCRWGEFAVPSGAGWPAFRTRSVSVVVGSIWYASTVDPAFAVGYSAADMLRYLVLQASVNITGGGLALAAGPFPNGRWEPTVHQFLTEFGAMLAPIRRSVVGTHPSSLWPTDDRVTISHLSWGVATEDHLYTYLHVLRPPAADKLLLPLPYGVGAPKRASRVGSSSLEISAVVVDSFLHLTVPGEWDPIDTVLQLEF